MIGKCGLYDDLALTALPACASGDLNDRLSKSFTRAKVCAKQALVGIDDANKGELGEMVSFGEHLCANENIRATLFRECERLGHRPLALCAVAVDALDAMAWKAPAQRFFEALGAFTQRFDRSTTLRTALVERAAATTMMATQRSVARVHGHARVATATFGDMSTA